MKKLLIALSSFLISATFNNVASCSTRNQNILWEVYFNWESDKKEIVNSDWTFKKRDIKSINKPKINNVNEDLNISHYKLTIMFNKNKQTDIINNKEFNYSVDSLIFFVDENFYNNQVDDSFKTKARESFLDCSDFYSNFFTFNDTEMINSITLDENKIEDIYGLKIKFNKTILDH